MSENELISVEEVSELLRVNEATVKRFAREKLIQSIDTEGELMFPRDAVMRYKTIHDKFNRQ